MANYEFNDKEFTITIDSHDLKILVSAEGWEDNEGHQKHEIVITDRHNNILNTKLLRRHPFSFTSLAKDVEQELFNEWNEVHDD